MINIYYRYSELDKRHEYSITDSTILPTVFLVWVFFYLGSLKLSKIKRKIILYPYQGYGHEKIIKSYKCNPGAKQIAQWASNFIINHYNKQVKKQKNYEKRRQGNNPFPN